MTIEEKIRAKKEEVKRVNRELSKLQDKAMKYMLYSVIIAGHICVMMIKKNSSRHGTSGPKMEIAFSCGFCGAPLDSGDNDVWPIPADYDPNKYTHSVCHHCEAEQYERERGMQVTHEMAMDAQDPDLEGTWI